VGNLPKTKMTLNNLEIWYKELWDVIIDVNICINNAKRLKKNVYKKESTIKRHGFFQHHWHQLRFVIIIRLCLLFDKRQNQKRNFVKLCNRIINDNPDKRLEEILKQNKLKENYRVFRNKKEFKDSAKKILKEIEEKKDLIQKLTDARDHVYAHYDPDVKVDYIKLDELIELNEMANRYYNMLHGQLFNVTSALGLTAAWDIDHLLKIMSEDLERKFKDLDGFQDEPEATPQQSL
jgi:hypothetical protein